MLSVCSVFDARPGTGGQNDYKKAGTMSLYFFVLIMEVDRRRVCPVASDYWH